MRAWKRADGAYTLTFEGFAEERRVCISTVSGRPLAALLDGTWVAPEEALAGLGAEKVWGVVTGPSSCGCEPAMFRWATEGEVRAGRTDRRVCQDCSRFKAEGVAIFWRCDIIDVCGEPDMARAVYEAEFATRIGALM